MTEKSDKGRGHPQWYGARFDLKDETTWQEPDETTLTTLTTHRGKVLTVTITAWHWEWRPMIFLSHRLG